MPCFKCLVTDACPDLGYMPGHPYPGTSQQFSALSQDGGWRAIKKYSAGFTEPGWGQHHNPVHHLQPDGNSVLNHH